MWCTDKICYGKATLKGWDRLHLLPSMTRAQLEQTLGINLHDATAPDFGRFDAAANPWYKEHRAGASYTPGKLKIPAGPAAAK